MTQLVLWAIAFVLPMQAFAPSAYSASSRRAGIESTLDAVAASTIDDLNALETALYLGVRTECRSAFGVPAVGCVVAMAQRRCDGESASKQEACARIADVIVTNLLAERQLVGNRERLALMNKGDDFRAQMRHELRRRYALLAADYAMSRHYRRADRAAGIDTYCVETGRERDLPWQRCVAALIWYMGTER